MLITIPMYRVDWRFSNGVTSNLRVAETDLAVFLKSLLMNSPVEINVKLQGEAWQQPTEDGR